MCRLNTPKIVTLPNGRTFVACFKRVPRSELPAHIRLGRTYRLVNWVKFKKIIHTNKNTYKFPDSSFFQERWRDFANQFFPLLISYIDTFGKRKVPPQISEIAKSLTQLHHSCNNLYTIINNFLKKYNYKSVEEFFESNLSQEHFNDIVIFYYYMCARTTLYYMELTEFHKKLLKFKKNSHMTKKKFLEAKK